MQAAERIAREVLRPAAEVVDRAHRVPDEHFRALAGAGLFGLAGPVEHGGHDAPLPVVREVFATLAGACGVTFFTWVQHHAPVRLLAGSPNTDLAARLLPRLCTGATIGGVAFAHLRRPGPPAVTAEPAGHGAGYTLRGEAPWVTSWSMAEVYAVAAQLGEDRVVFVAVPGKATEHVRPSVPLDLLVMSASRTVRLAFHDLRVDESDVISVLPLADWRARDRVLTAQPTPPAFGVAATCIGLLAERDAGAAAALAAELDDCRGQSFRLADQGDTGEDDLRRLVDLRAWSLELALRSAYALVAATGGRSMERTHPAQRLLREAAFYAIQAQSKDLRRATLSRARERC